MSIPKKRKGAILLDVGCCLGTDVRKAAVDGWPIEYIIGSDLRRGYWVLGHELFNTVPESFPATFLEGDLLEAVETTDGKPQSDLLPAYLSEVILEGGASVIHASALFHLFNEQQQRLAAARLLRTLSCKPGSMILGAHVGLPKIGYQDSTPGSGVRAFCHDPQSWEGMWEEVWVESGLGGLGGLRLAFETELRDTPAEDTDAVVGDDGFWFLVWSVTLVRVANRA
ncbi:hypothetical protein HGRIS_002213 [Hohenbuehelia grisea]|uniref:Uncharacterized protein n=1 Tax=Hohenbuehelia grisea TaxID=104357 RepID=A0ABR3JJX5_9AGAR